jgi:hypothetical protein
MDTVMRSILGCAVIAPLLILSAAGVAGADSQAYVLTGSFNMIAGATGNIVGYPTDPRLLPVMTPVGEFTAGASGTLSVDLTTGELEGIFVDVDDASFTLDATWHIGGLPAPPHGTISNANMSHTATGGEIGVVAFGEIDFVSGVLFPEATGIASCSSPFGALFCLNDSIGPFFDVNTGEIYPIGLSNAFTIDILPDNTIELTIVFDTGIVTGDAQAVQTMTLVGSPGSPSAVPSMGWGAAILLTSAFLFSGLKRLAA